MIDPLQRILNGPLGGGKTAHPKVLTVLKNLV
jgi:hypothetical protein